KNAVVPLLLALGPKEIDAAHRPQFYRMLRIDWLPEHGEYYRPAKDVLSEQLKPADDASVTHTGPVTDTADAPASLTSDDLDKHLEQAQTRPWSKREFPNVTAWVNA